MAPLAAYVVSPEFIKVLNVIFSDTFAKNHPERTGAAVLLYEAIITFVEPVDDVLIHAPTVNTPVGFQSALEAIENPSVEPSKLTE